MEKMRSGFKAGLCVVFLVLGYCGYAQTLWQNARSGMTVEEIKGVYPNAVSVEDGELADDGAKELLKLNEVMISNESFSAGFFFRNNKLTSVALTPNDEYTQALGNRVYDMLYRSLAIKYGGPIGGANSISGNRRTNDTTWVSEGTEIFLSKEEFIGATTSIVVIYRRWVEGAIDVNNL